MASQYNKPINIGSDKMVTINFLAKTAMKIANKQQKIIHVPGPLGVKGRNSDDNLIKEKLIWSPELPLEKGLEITYKWI